MSPIDEGPMTGFTMFNVTVEGTHSVHLNLSLDSCSQTFHNFSFATSHHFLSHENYTDALVPEFRTADSCAEVSSYSRDMTVYGNLYPEYASLTLENSVVFIPPGA